MVPLVTLWFHLHMSLIATFSLLHSTFDIMSLEQVPINFVSLAEDISKNTCPIHSNIQGPHHVQLSANYAVNFL